MEALNLSTDVLRWAADQAGQSWESLASTVVKRVKDRERLLLGQLTSSQVEKVAKLTGVPFGLLFLKAPPEIIRPPIPDLRQTVDPKPLSKDFYEVWDDALRKQQWYVERLNELGAQPLSFVGKFRDAAQLTSLLARREGAAAKHMAADITSTLGLSADLRRKAKTTEEYFSAIADKAEAAGFLVMKSGIVRANTRRPLSVKEFRGFAIADPLAPLVFVNGRDVLVANVFTLLHEIAHIWIGQSGVSDLSSSAPKGIEYVCNQVAAEVLVPKGEFLKLWEITQDPGRIAKVFRVSRLVIARRALDLGVLDQSGYDVVAKASASSKPASGGGSAYRTIPARNSKRLTKALVKSALSGDTLLREAASLLSVRPQTVMELGRRLAQLG